MDKKYAGGTVVLPKEIADQMEVVRGQLKLDLGFEPSRADTVAYLLAVYNRLNPRPGSYTYVQCSDCKTISAPMVGTKSLVGAPCPFCKTGTMHGHTFDPEKDGYVKTHEPS